MQDKIAVFPGSFDPITIGHVDVVKRAAPLFDKVIIALGNNTSKKYYFSFEQREKWMRDIFKDLPNVEVMAYQGLTVNFTRSVNARYLIRGIRNAADFDYEKTIAQLNKSMAPELETICIISDPEMSHISSTIVREILINGGDVSKFVPAEINNDLKQEGTTS
ncbi:MAG: pantetheine-phosphate adenylyltransferase [Chitinophagales bacterium]|nr:pantetheine-phosphate adenylyltransferase [Chitinophagales bacterium]